MSDYRSMYEGTYLGAWNLVNEKGEKVEPIVTISSVEAGTITGEGGKKSKKPLIHFEGKSLPMVIGKTVGKTIAGMYGTEVNSWVGKRIQLYATTTQFGGQDRDCIRVRPTPPTETRGKPQPGKPREPGEEG
jgi:hypothetical protein